MEWIDSFVVLIVVLLTLSVSSLFAIGLVWLLRTGLDLLTTWLRCRRSSSRWR